MSWPALFDRSRLDLFARDRIAEADARRQMATAEEILRRLERQPGLVLADEVGMGKTFVALAVAASVVWADRGRNPVVVMVPPSLKDKWPRDFDTFKNLCVRSEFRASLTHREAFSGLDFFRVLDDKPSVRARIIFLTHGAFHRNLDDRWVKFAILRFAMHWARLGAKRDALPRFAPGLLRAKGKYGDPELYRRLLRAEPDRWRGLIAEYGEDPGDDPIPEAIWKVLERGQADLQPLREQLDVLPTRESAYIDERLADARQCLKDAMQGIWQRALAEARFRSPLLVLDEAHHLKNPSTKLASLFVEDDAKADAAVLRGALQGGFERMLFLTATPFQLGHGELLNVLDRFDAIDWRAIDSVTREEFAEARVGLRKALDSAQMAAADLDQAWGKLSPEDLVAADGAQLSIDDWWSRACASPEGEPERVKVVIRAYGRAREALRKAQEALRPWVIRHMRPRQFARSDVTRRQRHSGAALAPSSSGEAGGLSIADSALLPFLLSARCQAMVSRASQRAGASRRATFAEGLASSYEAFLETRTDSSDVADEVEVPLVSAADANLRRYLDKLHAALPGDRDYAQHPKVRALVERVRDLWAGGEKVVVFCHFRATGRALVKHLSAALERDLYETAGKKMGVEASEGRKALRLLSDGFDEKRSLRRVLDESLDRLLREADDVDEGERERIRDIIRRFVRTPLFLGRYLDLAAKDQGAALERALTVADGSGASLSDKVQDFVRFIARRCQPIERSEYLEALEGIHSGTRRVEGDGGEDATLLPTVRLANGGVREDTRRRLMLAFNTPFFPEVLVASSVLAEGVDLHLHCRYLVHHDLCWNPSTIEQRTGRVDRIGAKAERVGQSINVFMPFVGGTQDEKMYRVVCDRERWFQVVMGEKYETDEFATDKGAERVPLPESAAAELVLRLEIDEGREAEQAAG